MYLSMPMHSPWNQSSQRSQAIMKRWLSGPRQRQYGPLSDSPLDAPPASSAPAPAPSSEPSGTVAGDVAVFFFDPPTPPAPPFFLPPPGRARFGAFTMVAVPFFLFAADGLADAGLVRLL